MNLLVFKSGHNRITCHPDKVDYFIESNEIKSGVVINGNFHTIKLSEIESVIDKYMILMEQLEGINGQSDN
jgi:hypothetical protein